MVTEDPAAAGSRDTWPAANPGDVPSSPAALCIEASYFPDRCRQPAIPPAPVTADGLPRARCGLRAPRAGGRASRILGSVGEARVGRHAEPPASNPANGPGKHQGSAAEACATTLEVARVGRPKRGRGPVPPLPARGRPRPRRTGSEATLRACGGERPGWRLTRASPAGRRRGGVGRTDLQRWVGTGRMAGRFGKHPTTAALTETDEYRARYRAEPRTVAKVRGRTDGGRVR